MKISYQAQGICAQVMNIETEGNIIKSVEIIGGCPGNREGYSRLLPGMDIEHVIQRLEGIPCKTKPSSCPDQLAQALKLCLAESQGAESAATEQAAFEPAE